MWNIWSRGWETVSRALTRWYFVHTRHIGFDDVSLQTRLGRDGARWHVLSTPTDNVIHVHRQPARAIPARRRAATKTSADNNVLPFAGNVLQHATRS